MKKINKNGFTLIELLAVLVILSIIMTIAIPNITSSLERSKNKQKKAKEELIESAAELYVDSHQNTINSGCINITTLIDNKLLTREEVKDPTNENYTLCGCVAYDKTANSFTWSSREDQPDSADYRYPIE